ncbi:osteopetrosis-associated transmembrane protein 1 isoform X3 [Schistocerca nitens]|uniref:osteopetrosis-associated transmembrane protein 1 isoform X3 n=1 Tax=Schistocerca nitens TaxID=7011 RepID=UPI00211735A7|nr:osteopetrosis-associated transmembrane protein 1 isoform X3 [Schistocerca nitens]
MMYIHKVRWCCNVCVCVFQCIMKFVLRSEMVVFIFTLINFCSLLTLARADEMDKFDSSRCTLLLQDFARLTSNFTFCAINYSRPITLCETCIKEYLQVIDAHTKILEMKDERGEKCKTKLINQDRLEVIYSAYHYVSNLWSDASCDSCFVKMSNGSLTQELSNTTVEFQHLHDKTHKCFLDHYYVANKTFDKNICSDCEKSYCEMNDYYDRLKKEQEMGVCVDIVDTMNRTRSFWSGKLGCDRKNHSVDVYLVCLFTLMAIVPVIFYTSLRSLVRKTEHKLLVQKRLAEHLSRPSTSTAAT